MVVDHKSVSGHYISLLVSSKAASTMLSKIINVKHLEEYLHFLVCSNLCDLLSVHNIWIQIYGKYSQCHISEQINCQSSYEPLTWFVFRNSLDMRFQIGHSLG